MTKALLTVGAAALLTGLSAAPVSSATCATGVPMPSLQAPDTLRLGALQARAVDEDARSRRAELERTAADLRLENLSVSRLPQLQVRGDASYQSEVISLPVESPTFAGPLPPKERYELALDVDWRLWDGGVGSSRPCSRHRLPKWFPSPSRRRSPSPYRSRNATPASPWWTEPSSWWTATATWSERSSASRHSDGTGPSGEAGATIPAGFAGRSLPGSPAVPLETVEGGPAPLSSPANLPCVGATQEPASCPPANPGPGIGVSGSRPLHSARPARSP